MFDFIVCWSIFDPVRDAVKWVLNWAVNNIVSPLFGAITDISGTIINGILDKLGVTKFLVKGAMETTVNSWKSLHLQNDLGSDLLNEVMLNGADSDDAVIGRNAIMKMLERTPKDFFRHESGSNPYDDILSLMKSGVLPTAMVIFSLIVMVELFQLTLRTEGMRNSGFEAPFKLMFKVGICKIFLDNIQLVLEAIFETGAELVKNMRLAYGNMSNGATEFERVKKLAEFSIKQHWDIITAAGLYFSHALEWILINLFLCSIPFMLLGRIIEMYVMIVISPIPLSTFASQEFSQVGKNFLKQFIGISMRPAAMYAVILVYLIVIDYIGFSGDDMLFWAHEAQEKFNLTGDPSTWGAIPSGVWTIYVVNIWGGVFSFVFNAIKAVVVSIMLAMSVSSADKYTKMMTGAWY